MSKPSHSGRLRQQLAGRSSFKARHASIRDGIAGPGGQTGDRLTEAEAELVRAALAGEDAVLKRRPIRAGVLRDLLLELRPGWVLPPAGLRLEHAIIQRCLDLDGCTLTKPFLVWHSRFEGGGQKGAVVIRDGRLKRLGIHSCTVEGNVVADRVEVDNGIFLGGGLLKGTLLLRCANIGGALALDGTEFGDGKAALLGAGLWAGAARPCRETDCFDESVFVIRNKDAYREEAFRRTYPGFHSLAYSFDVFVPVDSFGYEDHWRPNLEFGPIAELPIPRWPWLEPPDANAREPTLAITVGGILYVLLVIEAIIGLVLTSLMVTGFTGLLRGRD